MSRAADEAPRARSVPVGSVVNVVIVVGVAACLIWSLVRAGPAGAEPSTAGAAPAGTGDPERGEALYVAGCVSCHAVDGSGVPGRGPSLEDSGPAALDFYLTSGRMPASGRAGQGSERKPPAYTPDEIADLVVYASRFGDGPPIPDIRPEEGDLAAGQQLYTANCASCHNSAGSGGALGQGYHAPSVTRATNLQVAEAVRVGPGAMPAFGPGVLGDEELESITRYVGHLREPDDRGGLSLGRIGPVTEGMVTWLVGVVVLVAAARLIGARE